MEIPVQLVRILQSIKLALIIGVFASGVYADQIAIYSIDFGGGNLDPTSGTFSLDETTDQFLSFTVDWDGLTFDFMNSLATEANLFSLGSCPALSASIIVSYFLGEGTCTTPATVTWSGNWQSASNSGFNFVIGNDHTSFGFTALPTGTPLIVDNTVGTATASLATPEPTTLSLCGVVLALTIAARLMQKARSRKA
jgi:hypothetical protein